MLAVLASLFLVTATAVAGYRASRPPPAAPFRYAGELSVAWRGNDRASVPVIFTDLPPTHVRGQRPVIRRSRSERGLGGKIRFDAVHRQVRHHSSIIRFCFARGLESDPELHGRVSIQLIIDPFGAVTTAQVVGDTLSNPHASPALTECLVSEVRGWRFPRPAGGAKSGVVYPFVFSPD